MSKGSSSRGRIGREIEDNSLTPLVSHEVDSRSHNLSDAPEQTESSQMADIESPFDLKCSLIYQG